MATFLNSLTGAFFLSGNISGRQPMSHGIDPVIVPSSEYDSSGVVLYLMFDNRSILDEVSVGKVHEISVFSRVPKIFPWLSIRRHIW